MGMRSIWLTSIILSFAFIIYLPLESFSQNDTGGTWDPSDIENMEAAANIGAGTATAVALGFLAYQTLKLRDERNKTFRAWIGMGEPQVFVHGYFNEEKKFIPKEKWQQMLPTEKGAFGVKELRRYIEIKNYGQLPATNLKARTKFTVGQQPTKKYIQSESFGSSSTIMPTGSLKLFFMVSKDEEQAIEDPTKDCYLIFEMEYESPKGKKRKYGEISSVSQQQYGVIESWDEKN